VAARNKLAAAASSEDILRCEADGAQAYWKAWHDLPIMYPRIDLPRVPAHWQQFGSRMSALTNSPRLAANPPNAMLNYLYALLESEARLALAAMGLDPGIGVLHKDTRTRDSLASDLMEPVRPQVDAFLVDWLKREPLCRQWFFEERNGNCRLMSSLATRLSETSELWRRAVAPFVEGIARALWSGREQGARGQSPAPRLTQNRKREAKGIFTSTSVVRPPRQESVCRSCGTTIKPGQKYCRKCAPDVVKENILEAAKVGRLNTHKPEAQARRAETQRKHNAALKVWNPKDLPDWLDRGYFQNRIRPLLRRIPIQRIMSTINVSEPYAMGIRVGRRTPHPRHWLSLAGLVRTGEDRPREN
jgi:hypothetical protein